MATQEVFSQEEAKKRLEALPPSVRTLIYSKEMTGIIETIGKKYNLFIDKIGTLESETSFLMLGFTEPKDFARILSERIPIDPPTAVNLAQDVNDQLLVRVRSALKEMYLDAEPPRITPDIPQTGESVEPIAQQLAQKPDPIIPGSAPAPLSSVDVTLTSTQASPAEKINIAPQVSPQPRYSKDPYREEIG